MRGFSFLWQLVLGAVGGILLAGCQHDGDVQISWNFVAAGDATETAADGCGAHGVDAILITGSSIAGDGTNVIALCTPGTVTHQVPVGTWTFAVHTVNALGKSIRPIDEPDGMTDPIAVGDGATAIPPVVSIIPRFACSDGIDNDRDGRVDLDDPDCAGDPNGTSESSPPAL